MEIAHWHKHWGTEDLRIRTLNLVQFLLESLWNLVEWRQAEFFPQFRSIVDFSIKNLAERLYLLLGLQQMKAKICVFWDENVCTAFRPKTMSHHCSRSRRYWPLIKCPIILLIETKIITFFNSSLASSSGSCCIASVWSAAASSAGRSGYKEASVVDSAENKEI